MVTFKEISRQNTGRSFLDSGERYGRHYDRELPKKLVQIDVWESDGELKELSASIALGEFLDSTLEIDEYILNQLKQIAEDNPDNSHWDDMEAWAEKYNYTEVAADNTYNHENDLDQVFQFKVYMPNGNTEEWFYSEHAVIFIQTHNGCDVRGGYSEPIPCRAPETYWLDWNVGWGFAEGVDANGKPMDSEDLQGLDEQYQIGYWPAPTYHMNKDIEKIISVDKEDNHAWLLLKSGEKVKAYPYTRAEHC